jgi:hypothetical protein
MYFNILFLCIHDFKIEVSIRWQSCKYGLICISVKQSGLKITIWRLKYAAF